MIDERKRWVHFGAAKGKPIGEIDTDVTLISHEDVHIDAPFTKQKDLRVDPCKQGLLIQYYQS